MKMKKMILTISIILIVLPIQHGLGAWLGPTEIIVGSWGIEAGQFGLMTGDTVDAYPNEFAVDKNGMIVIADEVNKRVQIFKIDGSLYKVINKPTEINVMMWPASLIVLPEGDSFLANLYIYNYSGEIIFKINFVRTERYGISERYIINDLDNNFYYLYSSTGKLLKSYAERPLELGIVKEKKIAPGQYKVTVKYPDKEWVIIGGGVCQGYVRDMNGNLYCTGDKEVIRYNDKGEEVARLTMPEDKKEETPAKDPGVEPTIKVIEEYGSPIVAPNGDVYTWKRTPDKFYIIKWTWQ